VRRVTFVPFLPDGRRTLMEGPRLAGGGVLAGENGRPRSLPAGPQHGYGIIADAGRISAGAVRLQAGTLYTALDRLRSVGLVEPDREEVADRQRESSRLERATRRHA
jgi:Transcriptional regulator PadR-like family